MTKFFSSLLVAHCCLAATSVVLPAGKTGTAAYPGFTSAVSIRVEGRIHGFTYANAYSHGWYLTNQTNTLRTSAVGSNTSMWGIIQNNNQITPQNPPADLEFRWQRTASGRRIFEVWDIGAATPTVFYSNDASVVPAAIAAGNIVVGEAASPGTGLKFAYLRIFQDSPMAVGGLPPGASATPGNIANYEFEGATAAELGADTSGNGRNLTWSGGTAPATETTPVLPPVCNSGVSKTFRSGNIVTLDGSASWGMGGVPLLYMWTVTEQPTGSQVRFVNNINTGSPTIGIENAIAGQYTFRLLVSDGASLASCTVSHGVVPATTSGVVIPDVSTADKLKFHELLGPVIALYKLQEVWPYAAQVATYMEQYYRTLPGTLWKSDPPFWEDPAYYKPGTISLTPGSAIVTGTGTSLQTLICGGGTTPVTAGTGSRYIVFRYPSNEGAASTGGAFNWMVMQVRSCQSETQITLGSSIAPVNYTPRPDAAGNSGLNYYTENGSLLEIPSSNWSGTGGGPSSANFYDLAKASYGYHVATGLTAPLIRARQVAEAWIKSPYGGNRGYGTRFPRDMAMTGPAMRYLEDTTANAWIMTAINNQAAYLIASYTGRPVGEREEFYATMFAAECAYLGGASCPASTVNTMVLNDWKPRQCTGGVVHSWGRDCLNNWGQFAISSVRAADASFPTVSNPPWNGTSVSVTNGSRRVTLSGATWPATYWDWNSQNQRAFWIKPDNDTTTNDYPWAYRNDQVSGTTGTFTRVSDTQMDLPTPWVGPTGSGFWWQYYQYPGQYTTQPFIAGIGGYALWRVYRTTGLADALTMSIDQSNFIMDQGYNTTVKGMHYMRGALNCETVTNGYPGTTGGTGCTNSQSTSRFLNGETLRTIAYSLMTTGNPVYKEYGDKFAGAIFGDPSCTPNCGPETDGFGVDDIKIPGGSSYTTNRAKDFGFLYGMGGVLTYTAMRTGLTAWPMTPVTATVRVGFRLADIPGSDRVAITLKDQRGNLGTATVCLTSPCVITIPDRSAGNYQMQIAYRTGSTNRASGVWQQLKNVE